MSDRRGQVSALLVSTLVVSALVGVGVAAAFTDAGVSHDANLNSSGNEGDAVAAVHSIAFCPVSLNVDLEEFDPATAELPPVDPSEPLESYLFPVDPMQAQPGAVQWSLTFPGEYFVVIGYGDTYEMSGLYEGPGADGFAAGDGAVMQGLSAEQACGPNGFGVTYDFDAGTYDVLLPADFPPLDVGVDDLEDFESFEEFLAFVEDLAASQGVTPPVN